MNAARLSFFLGLAATTTMVRAASASGLRFFLVEPDHVSGIYHPADTGKLAVLVENSTGDALPLSGDIAFGTAPSGPADPFKPLSVTPITPTTVAPGQRAKLPLTLSFANVGPYELRWRATPTDAGVVISQGGGVALTCVFAPRTQPQPITAVKRIAPWVLPLPAEAANLPGYLTDLSRQTSVATFLLDERFRYDAGTKIALALGAGIDAPAEKVDALFTEAAQLRSSGEGGIVLRLAVPVTGDARAPEILSAYIADAHKRLRGSLRGIVLLPQLPENSPLTSGAARDRFHVLYLAAYKAAKAADKNVIMLGAGSGGATHRWLLEGDGLGVYVDALALTDVTQFADARTVLPNHPLWLVPAGAYHWGDVPAAAALAEGAVMVGLPAPADDRGVTAHLLGGSVLFQNLSAVKIAPEDAPANRAGLPYMAVFQGDHFSVAAIAGLGAGTPLDVRYPSLAAGKTVIQPTPDPDPGDPSYANVHVPNDQRSLRVVDALGATVECRIGDDLYIPAGDKVVYLLGPGNAEDLAALLRPAPVAGMPLFDFSLTIPPDVGGEGGGGLTLRMTNIADKEYSGSVRVFRPTGDAGNPPEPLATRDFTAVTPGKSLEVFLDAGTSIRPGQPLVLEFVTTRVIQRSGLILH